MPIPRLRRSLVASAAVIGSLLVWAAPSPASDGYGPGRSWPAGSIRLFNAAPAEQKAVDLAIAAWNSTGSRVKFVRVKRRALAQVVVRFDNTLAFCGLGWGSIGYPGAGGVAEVRIRKGPPAHGQSCAWPGQASVITHELGHVLGFAHQTKQCSIMNPALSMGRAPKLCIPIATGPHDAYVTNDYIGRRRCVLLEAGDVTRMVKRYGGRAPARPADPWCDVYAPIAPPEPLVATPQAVDDGAGGVRPAVRIDLVRPADPAYPPFIALDPLLHAGSMRDRILLYRTIGTCPTARPVDPFGPPEGTVLVAIGGWEVPVGGTQVVVDSSTAVGVTCYSAWAWDAAGRPSRTPAQGTITF